MECNGMQLSTLKHIQFEFELTPARGLRQLARCMLQGCTTLANLPGASCRKLAPCCHVASCTQSNVTCPHLLHRLLAATVQLEHSEAPQPRQLAKACEDSRRPRLVDRQLQPVRMQHCTAEQGAQS